MNEKLLITTVKKIILWDGRQNNVLEGNFYGCSWDDNFVFLSKNSPNIGNSIIEAYDKKFEFVKTITTIPNGDVHQICVYNNQLYITCTGLAALWVINLKTTDIKKLPLEGHGHHNSVVTQNEKIFVLDSRSQNGAFRIRIFNSVEILSLLSDQLYVTGYPSLHHNIFFDGNKIITLYHRTDGSLINRVLVFDRTSLNFEYKDPRKDKENGFLRGIAKNHDNYFFGEFQHENIREERLMGNSRVLITDNNFDLVDVINLQDTGQIRDVRLLSGDLTHNGINF